MTDTTWAAKVLEGVPRLSAFQTRDVADRATDLTDRKWLRYDDALAAIARMGTGDGLVERATAALEGVTPGKPCQFHPSYCKEAEGTPFSEWDSSHDLSVILPDGKRYKIGHFRHSADAGFDQFARQWVPEAAARISALTATVDRQTQMMDLWADDLAEAHKEAATLRARLAAMEGALQPFADAADESDEWGYDDDNQAPVTAGQCRDARAALTDGGKDG